MEIQELFLQYREFYAAQHPASVPEPEMYEEVSDTPAWLPNATAAMFVSSSLLSGVHTVSTVYRLMEVTNALLPNWVYVGVALFSFVSVELALLLSAFLIVREKAWGYAILAVVFLFAMTANLYSVSRAIGAAAGWGEIAVAVIMGIGAPLMALMAGKVYVQINRSERILAKRSKEGYQAARQKFDQEVIKAFNKAYPGAKMSVSVSVPLLSDVSNGLSSVSNGQPTGQSAASSIGHTKVVDASARVQQHLDAHPEDLNLSPRQLAAKLEVGKSTVNNVQRQYRTNGHSQNGHELPQ